MSKLKIVKTKDKSILKLKTNNTKENLYKRKNKKITKDKLKIKFNTKAIIKQKIHFI